MGTGLQRVEGEFVAGPGSGEAVRVQIHADAEGRVQGAPPWSSGGKGKRGGVPSRGGFLGPGFVRVVEVGFVVVGQNLPRGRDGDGGVVANWVVVVVRGCGCGWWWLRGGELGVADYDDALEARCGCFGPLVRGTGAKEF